MNVSIKGFILFIPLTLSPSFHCITTFIIMDLTLTWCTRLNVPYKRVCLRVHCARICVCVCVYFVCFVKRSICILKQCVYACEFAFLCEHASLCVCVCFCACVRVDDLVCHAFCPLCFSLRRVCCPPLCCPRGRHSTRAWPVPACPSADRVSH